MYKLRNLLVLLVTFILPAKIFAASSEFGVVTVECESTFFASFTIKNYPAFEPLSCRTVQMKLENAVTQVRQLSPVEFKSPRLVILNDEYAQGGSFDWRSNILELRITQKEKQQTYMVSFCHEMGHVIFNDFVLQKNPAAKELNDAGDFLKVKAGYDELFADVFATLLFNDLNIMPLALATSVEHFNYLSFNNTLVLDDRLARESHSRFSSFRKTFWREWMLKQLPRAATSGDRQKVLGNLAELFVNEVFSHYAEDIKLFKANPLSAALTEIDRLYAVLKIPKSTFIFCASSVYLGIKIENVEGSWPITCDDVQTHLEATYNKVRAIAPADMIRPFLWVKNTYFLEGNFYDWSRTTVMLNIPTRAHVDMAQIALSHELGHVIMNKYVLQSAPVFAEYSNLVMRYREYLKGCVLLNKTQSECDQQVSPVNDVDILNALFLLSDDNRKYYQVHVAYDELFADITASLAFNDPAIMPNSAMPCLDPDTLCLHRTFSQNTPLTSRWAYDAYGRFSFIRKTLWNEWIVPRSTQPQELLTELAQTFLSEAVENYQSDAQKFDDGNGVQATQEAGARLLKRLSL